MKKHTQGPWGVMQGDLIYAKGGRFIADCERTPFEKRPAPPDKEDHANALLIAAAPDLYEACKALLRDGDMPEIIEAIEEAIAKAEGMA